MSPDSTPSLRDSAKFRILRNLNTADVYDNLRRGPKHWSNVASELLLAFLDSRLATNAHLRFLDQLQDGRPARPNIAHMDTFTLRNSEIGFAGKAKKIDFGTKQLVPYSPITPNVIADNDTREVNQRIFQNHPTINPSLPRIHVLGPTSRDQEYNNGVLYRGEGDEVLGAITDFKGGIEIHRTDDVSVLSPEEINTRGLREDATAVFGVSQFIQTRRRDLNVTDAELFEHAIAISEANGYMISYNTRFGYLGDTGDALSYYVVRTNPFLINDLYHSFKQIGGALIDDFELAENKHMSRYVPFGNYLLLKALQADTSLDPDQDIKLAGLEEHYLAMPIHVKAGGSDRTMASGFHLVLQG